MEPPKLLADADSLCCSTALGLPMSTTHVSSGAIIGLGSQDAGRLNWKTVRRIVLVWIITVTAAALLGIAVFKILRYLGSS